VPRNPKDALPPWWLDPDNLARGSFNMLLLGKPPPAQAVVFCWFVTAHHVELLKLWRRLARCDPSGMFKAPAILESSRKQSGSPVELLESALFELINAAIYSRLLHPAQIMVGGPCNLDDPGDIVGVERVRNVEFWRKKGLRYNKLIHVKGVAGKILGVTITLFGRPLIGVTQTLTRMATGVPISRDEVRSLLP
jgi:hypothetical protein